MIPAFTLSGVLPPFVGTDPTVPAHVSPYGTTATELVGRFSTSPERADILRGLLTFRDRLRAVGITQGYQWLDGSFVEDIETLEARPPGDIDVVTLAHRPLTAKGLADWRAFLRSNISLFDHRLNKSTFKCDAYYLDLDNDPELVIQDTVYWYGLFAHRRLRTWKGMLRLPLTSDDSVAAGMLAGAIPW